MLEYLYRAKFEGVPSSETCDLIEEFLLTDDVNRKREILWQLVPETTDKLVENYINTAKVTAYNLLMDVTFPEQLMDTESGEERHKMVDDYISQMLANNEYWQKNKGTPWVEEMRQAMYKIPYIPLTQEQSKLQILMAESLRSEGSPYFPKCGFDDLPLRDKVAIRLHDSNPEMPVEEAYSFADWLIAERVKEIRLAAEKSKTVKEEPAMTETTDKIYYHRLFMDLNNIIRRQTIWKLIEPDCSDEEARHHAYNLFYSFMIGDLAPQYYCATWLSFPEFWEEAFSKTGVDSSVPWKTLPTPEKRESENMSEEEIYKDLFRELIYCCDFEGGLQYAKSLYPTVSEKKMKEMVEKIFSETGNLMTSPADDIHRTYLDLLLKEIENNRL